MTAAGGIRSVGDIITALEIAFEGLASAVGISTVALSAFLILPAAIGLASKAIDKFIYTYDETKEKSNDSWNAFQNTQSEVESLNSELETTKSRIDELKAKGSLTITEQDELTRLELQNKQLQLQYDLKSKLAQMQGKQAAEDASNVLTNDTRRYRSGSEINSKGVEAYTYDTGTIIDETYAKQKELNVITGQYNALLEKQSKLEPDYSSWWQPDTEYEKNEKRLKYYEDQMKTIQSEISTNVSEISTEYDKLFDSNGNVISGFEELANKVQGLFDYTLSSSDKAASAQEKIDSILSRPTLSNAKNNLIEMAKASDDAGISADDISKKYPELAKAAEDAGVKVEDLADTINSMSGVVNIDEIKNQLSEAFSGSSDEWSNFVSSMSNEEIKILYGIYSSQDTSAWSIEDWNIALDESQGIADKSSKSYEELKSQVDSVSESMKTFQSAMSNSVSGSGISVDEFSKINDMFSGLEGYDASKLFETTANGIRINTEAARELTAQYEAQTKLDLANKLSELGSQYDDLTEQLKNCTDGSEEYNQILSQRDAIESEIQNVSLLASEYDGLTSKYQKWIDAQSSADEGNMYDTVTSNLKKMKDLYEKGLVGTDDFRAGVDFMTYQDMSNASVDELVEAYKKANKTMNTYFTDGQKGSVRFLEDVHKINSEWASMNEDGSWEINFNDEEVAKSLGTSVEAVQAILRKLNDYGFEINLDSPTKSIQTLKEKIEETESALKDMGETPIEIDINADDINSEIDNAKSKIQEINESEVSAEVKTAQLEDANAKLDALIQKKHEAENPAFMSVDVNQVNASLTEAVGYLKEYQTAVNNLDTLEIKGADSSEIESAKKKVDELAGKIQGLDKDTKVTIGLEADGSIDSIKKQIASGDVVVDVSGDTTKAKTEIDNINGTDVSVNVNTSGNEALDALKSGLESLTDKTVTVTAKVVGNDEINNIKKSQDAFLDKKVTTETEVKGEKEVKSLTESIKNLTGKVVKVIANVIGKNNVDNLRTSINNVRSKTVYINSISKSSVAKYNGTAHANGTAYVSGNWGAKRTETALMGEVGEELLVRGDKWITVGSQGAEFFPVRKHDIIFNADQTREIFAKGKLTTGNTRGKSFASGTAYNSTANGKFYGSSNKTSSSSKSSSKSSSSSKKKTTTQKATEKAAKSVSSAVKDAKDFFDFAEIKLSRLSDATDAFIKSAENSEKLSSILTNYQKAINNINNEISANQSAYSLYKSKADKVKLSNSIKARIQNGSINVDEYSDEIRKLISQYQDFYEKALKCKQAISDLKAEQKELAKTKLDTIIDRYAMITDYYDSKRNVLEGKIDYVGASGSPVTDSTTLYNQLIANESNTIKKYQEALSQYASELNKQIKSGLIENGSDEYYEAYKQIQELNAAILESQTSIKEWSEEIQNIKTTQLQYSLDASQRAADKIKNYIDLMEAQHKVVTASDYNSQIKQNNTLIAKQDALIKAYQDAQKSYSSNSEKYQEIASNIESCEDEINNLRISNEELKDAIKDLRITKLEYVLGTVSRAAEKLKNSLSLKEAKGESLTESDYSKQIKYNNDLIEKQKDLIREYTEQQKEYSVDSDKYQELAENIADCENEINDLLISNEELKDSIREARWQKFNELQAEIDNSITELEYLRSMLGDTFIDEKGKLTDSGIANIALINQGIAAQKGVIADYTEALHKLDKELENGNISQSEYNDLQKEYMSIIRDSASEIKDYEDELIDMYKSQLEAQNDVLSDEIDMRKKALEAKKDYYDYDKTIRSKNKDIQSLKSQIAALEGTTTAAGRAKMAQLKAELREAQEDLDDTMRNHEYEIKISGYDQMKDDAQDALDSTLRELETNSELQQSVVNNMLGTIKNRYSTAYSEINEVIRNTGLVISDTTKNSISELKNVTSAIQAVNDAIANTGNTKPSNIVSSVDTSEIDTSVKNETAPNVVHSSGTENAISNSGTHEKETANVGSDSNASSSTKTSNSNASSSPAVSSVWNGIGTDTSNKGNKSLNINSSIVDRVKYNGYKSDKTSRAKLYSNLGGSGTYEGTAKQNTWMISQLKSKGYASGIKSASAGYHWYDEYGIGSEMYIDNGGILKQFEGGETVFNQDMVKNLWNIAQTPPSVLLDNIGIGKEVYPVINNSNNQTSNVNNTFNVDFNIDKLGKTSPQEMKKLYEEFYKYVDKRITTQAHNYGVKKKV